MMSIKLASVNNYLESHLENSLQFVLPFAWLSIIGYPLFFVLFYQTEIWWLNLVGTMFGLLSLITHYLPRIPKSALTFLWLSYLTFNFPFNFTYGLLANPSNVAYELGQMIMFMCVTIVISDIVILSIVLVLGIVLAFLLYGHDPLVLFHQLNLKQTGYLYLLGLVFGLILMHRKSKTEKVKLEGATSTAYLISHEIGGLLYKILLASETLQKYMPILSKGYRIARKQRLIKNKLTSEQLILTKNSPNIIQTSTNSANTIVEMLLMNLKSMDRLESKHTAISMYDCIEQALARYPYEKSINQQKIHWKKSIDFTFVGIEQLMIHVLFNLIKNAYTAIEKSGKGKIQIYNRSDEQTHYLIVEDTASGIDKKQLSKLFDFCFTTNTMGNGIGLYFCKNVIETFSGKILCESVRDEYTRFIITLPTQQSI